MKNKILLFALLTAVCTEVNGQSLDNYTFTTGIDSTRWVVLTNPDTIVSSNAGYYYCSSTHSIGFDFPIGGEYYSSFCATTNGLLHFGDSTGQISDVTNPFLYYYERVFPCINGFGSYSNFNGNGYVACEMTGMAPNRKLVVEFVVSYYSSSILLRWQVQISENGNIQLVYKNQPSSSTTNRYIGICARESDMLVIHSDNTVTHHTSSNGISNPWTVWPATNRYYSFQRPANDCRMPRITDLSVVDDSVTVWWEPLGAESSWSVVARDNGTAVCSTTTNVTHASLGALFTANRYTIEVTAECGPNSHSAPAVRTFRSNCHAIGRDQMPWLYGFEDSFDEHNNTLDPCLHYLTDNSNMNSGLYGYDQHSGNYSYNIPYGSNSSLALPPFEVPLDSLILKFWYYTSSNVQNSLIVYTLDDVNDYHIGDTLFIENNPAPRFWKYVELPLAMAGSGGHTAGRTHIAFYSLSSILIDDIEVDILPPCPKAYNIQCRHLNDSVSLEWQYVGDNCSWQVDLVQDNTVIYSLTTSDTVCGLGALMPNTSYTAIITSICGDTLFGESSSITFTTACNMVRRDQLPWHHGFETTSPSDVEWAGCLTKVGTFIWSAPNSTSNVSHKGHQSLLLSNNNTYIALPLFEDEIGDLALSFWYRGGSLQVGIKENLDFFAEMTPVAEVSNTSNEWKRETVKLRNYSGNGGYIVLKKTGNPSVYLDDITVSLDGFCEEVIGFDTVCITSDSVKLAWNGYEGEPVYTIKYGTAGYDPHFNQSVSTIDTFYCFYGLAPSSRYNFKISRVCDEEGESSESVLSLSTPCGSLYEDFLPYFEDFEHCENSLPRCWSIRYDATSPTNTITHIPPISGDHSLHLYSGTFSSYSLAALPQIETALTDISQLTLSFTARKTPNWEHYHTSRIDVGVMSNPNDTSTFVNIYTVDLGECVDNTTRDYIVPFSNYYGSGSYIAFFCHTMADNHIAIDNVTLSMSSDPMPPSRVAVANISTNSVTLSWKEDPSVSAWNVYYCESYKDITLSDTTIPVLYTASNTITIDSLVPYNEYHFAVAPANTSTPRLSETITVVTPGREVAIEELPYHYIQEDMIYWFAGSTSCVLNPPSISAQSSLHYGRIAGNNLSGDNWRIAQYLALPSFESPVQSLFMKFVLRSSNNPGYCYVGVMSNPYDINTFDTMAFYKNATMQGNYYIDTITHPFNNYSGTGKFIAILAPGQDTSVNTLFLYRSIFLPNIEVNTLYNCHQPIHLVVDSITESSALVSWNSSPDVSSGYLVACSSQENFNPDTCTSLYITTDTSFSISGLMTETRYWWTVSTGCAVGSSAWAPQQSFVTKYNCGADINLSCTIGEGSLSSPVFGFFNSSTAPHGLSASIVTMQELNEVGVEDTSVIRSLTLFPETLTALPNITHDRVPHIRLFMKEVAETHFNGIGDTTLLSGMTCVFNGPLQMEAGQSCTIELTTPFTIYGQSNLLVAMVRDSVASCGLAMRCNTTDQQTKTLCAYLSSEERSDTVGILGSTFDILFTSATRADMELNVCYNNPLCKRPTRVRLTALGATSATLAWEGDAPLYEYKCLPSGAQMDVSIPGTSVNDSLVTVTGLQPESNYDFYVRGICNPEASAWSRIFSFTTSCAPTGIPYLEDFESAPTSGVPPCWHVTSEGETLIVNSYVKYHVRPDNEYAIDGNRSLLLSTAYRIAYPYNNPSYIPHPANYVSLPLIGEPLGTLMLSFDISRNESPYSRVHSLLEVGIMTVPYDSSTFHSIATVDLSEMPSLYVQHVDMALANAAAGNAFADDKWYIAFRVITDSLWGDSQWDYENRLRIDNIVVDRAPECAIPTGINIVRSQTNSDITVRWNNCGASIYEVEIGNVGFTPGNGRKTTTNDTMLLYSGLSYSKTYDVYVRSICSGGDTSLRSSRYTFSTNCGLMLLPYTQDFENEKTDNSYPIPHCWTRICQSDNNENFIHTEISNSEASGGYKYLYMRTSSPKSAFALLPAINTNRIAISETVLVFDVRSQTNGTELEVGLMNSPTDTNSFTLVATINATTAWIQHTVPFAGHDGDGHIMAFRLRGTGSQPVVFIDNVVADDATRCIRPESPRCVSVGIDTVSVEWEGDSELYLVATKKHDENVWSEATAVHGVSHTFRDLESDTWYDWRVCAQCPNDSLSRWVEGDFYTIPMVITCPAPTELELQEIDLNSAGVIWTPGGEERFWKLHVWNTVFDSVYNTSGTRVTIGGLTQAVEYWVAVKAVCDEHHLSTYSDTVSFTTASCPATYDVEVSDITTTTASVSWRCDAELFDMEYGISGFPQGTGTMIRGIESYSQHIEGLRANRSYDVYVRSLCEGNFFGYWSEKVSFETIGDGVETVDGDCDVRVFPNPTSGIVNIAIPGLQGTCTITVSNLLGVKLYETTIYSTDGNTIAIDLSKLGSGLYILQLQDSNTSYIKRLTVVR